MRERGVVSLVVILVILVVGLVTYIIYQNVITNLAIEEIRTNISSIPDETSLPTPGKLNIDTPSPTPSNNKQTNTPEPSITPSPKTFGQEEELMRKTLAGFEMYIGGSNTSGALSFFTPPVSAQAKAKYDEIRPKNLPFSLTSWSFIRDHNDLLAVDELKNGYRARVKECRTNDGSCPILFIELVRDNEAENGFSVDRYYTSEYMYQSNLGEEIKYQGFGL